jgi:methionine-rich copper-binding protein CopC
VLVGPPARDLHVLSNRRPCSPDVIGPESLPPRPDSFRRLLSAKSPHCRGIASAAQPTSIHLNARFGDAHILATDEHYSITSAIPGRPRRRTITMKTLLTFLSIALFSSTSTYAAHSARAQLVKSTAVDGSVSDTPPSVVVLEFTEVVHLHEVYIKKEDGKSKPLDKLPSKDAATITIPAPSLTAGHYVLEWSVFTHESVALSGRIRFTVSAGSSTESSSPH